MWPTELQTLPFSRRFGANANSSPQLFHSVPRGTLFGFLNFVAWFILAPASIRYGPTLQSGLRTSQTLQGETIRGAPIANFVWSRRHSGESLMFLDRTYRAMGA